ncbi:hypothetical protein [Actinomyces naeslundii]|uniref:hypothetical protein n=1 Tax=Actinomyces naeslundii TaxID=1655 RepID=UPI0028EA9F95|nr:hypothetical protein [Actinomyces naeslundii]
MIDKQFKAADEQYDDVRRDYKSLSGMIKDLDYKWEERFTELKAGQTKLKAGQDEVRAEMARLRRSLFHESGSRETADETLYGDLDRRLRLVEAKFPDLMQQAA